MVTTFNGIHRTTIISCYSPTNVSDETDLITFYNELSSHVRSNPKQNVLVIGGDRNAPISKNVNHKFSRHNSSNRNGKHLRDFTLENRLTCLNTKFEKKKENHGLHPRKNNTKTQINDIVINKNWSNSALDCESYFCFEGVSSNHRIVTAKIQQSLRRNAARTTTNAHDDWSLLNRDIWDEYTLTLRNKVNALQEISETFTPNDEYKNFVHAL